MAKHEEQDWFDPDPEINRDIYVPLTCTTCGVERDMVDFYDGTHAVNIVEHFDGRENPYEFMVDHGELAQQHSTQEVIDSGI